MAWTTVGPGGRPQPGRPINSGGINPNVPPQSNVSGPSSTSITRVSPARTTSLDQRPQQPVKSTTPVNGVEDFQKWCRSQLKSLTGVNCNPFICVLVFNSR